MPPSPHAPAPPRRILLVDCDQFFVQCARLADPEGVGRQELLLVGGRPDARGVVTSASYPTRAFGVRSGMPMARALRLCPEARVVPVPGPMCAAKSASVRRVLERWAPRVEAASVDEAYLELTGTEALYAGETLRETARRIQESVWAETDIRVSIGGGTSKLVAKLAVRPAKPNGVHIVAPGCEEAFLAELRLEDSPGVGPVFTEELRGWGLVTVRDALRQDEATLTRWLGGRGAWLHARIRGRDESPVSAHGAAKQVSRDETFPRDLDRDEDLERELLALAVRLGSDLRGDGLRARTLTVRIRDADFRTRQAGRTLPTAAESDGDIYRAARELLRKLRAARRVPARLLGVAASGLVDAAAPVQLGLFEGADARGDAAGGEAAPDPERTRRLTRAVDALRDRFGPDAVRPGRLLDR
ncbi:MAG TPA: DNA polymerase IV [Longimicrobiales bacterium]|nr:DNA polymerase IV [Longimicrobiales bacterium]